MHGPHPAYVSVRGYSLSCSISPLPPLVPSNTREAPCQALLCCCSLTLLSMLFCVILSHAMLCYEVLLRQHGMVLCCGVLCCSI